MELRYSPTCGTNWVRANILVNDGANTVTKGIRRMSSQPDGNGGWLGYFEQYEPDPAVGSSYGMQVYAPGTTCVDVSAVVRAPSGAVIASTNRPDNPWFTFC
ncbi:hypothetical protein LV79_002949 [Actinokineospora globicatena]|nr:hypothetical protein [Actinokineospora globicatena]